MPITVEWDDANQAAVRVIFETPWEWKDFHVAIQEVADLASPLGHKVCLILDAQKSVRNPDSNALSHYRKAIIVLNPYVELNIGVGTVSFTQKLASIIMTVMGAKFEFVETLEEARQLVKEANKTES